MKKMVLVIVVSIAIASSLIAFALFVSSPSRSSRSEDLIVSIEFGSSNLYSGKSYSPFDIVIVLGVNNTLSWRNDDVVAHTVTSESGFFDSGILDSGKKWTYSFNEPGIYRYRCTPHLWMTGSVIVKDRAPLSIR